MNNFEKWKESLSLDRMIIEWCRDCEKCPIESMAEYCKDYQGLEHCEQKLIAWANSEPHTEPGNNRGMIGRGKHYANNQYTE